MCYDYVFVLYYIIIPVVEQRLAAVNLQQGNLTSERQPDGHQVASHQVATSILNYCSL